MLRRLTRIMAVLSFAAAALTVATPSQAVPAFARQTGKACSTCHYQHYPTLNDYGMDFKASGYTTMGKQGTVKGADLSLAEMLNASIFTKIRYQKDNGSDTPDDKTRASGEWQFPDEAALLLGGRIAENVGFLFEGQMADNSASFFAGFKMPFMFKVGDTMRVGVVPFTTDGLGASYGFEMLSTGAVRNIRVMEHRAETSAQQYLGLDGPARGLTFVLWDPAYFVNVTRWTPNHIHNASSKPTSNYLRAAWTPTFNDWSLGLGVQSWSGSASQDGADFDTKAWAVDAQAHGTIGNYPVGFYVTHGAADGSTPGSATPNLFNGNPNKEKATTVLGEVGIIPNKLMLQLGLRFADNGAASGSSDDAVTFGITYRYTQNIGLHLEHSTRDKNGAGIGRYDGSLTRGSARTTFMLSAGF